MPSVAVTPSFAPDDRPDPKPTSSPRSISPLATVHRSFASGEIDRGLEVGLGSGLSTGAKLGVTATLGMAAYQRDRILEGARDLLDREE